MSTLEVFNTWGDTMMSVGGIIMNRPEYTAVSIEIQLFSQLPSPTFIMISPGVLNIGHCTAQTLCRVIKKTVVQYVYVPVSCQAMSRINLIKEL